MEFYFLKFYKEIRIWRKFYKIAKQNEDYLNKNNLRVDWIGRIYTVVNVPEEIATNNQYVKEAWVLQQLRPYNDILLKIGLADYAIPELRNIDIPNTNAFLILLYPELKYVNIWKLLWNIFKLVIIIWLIKIFYHIVINFIDIIESISKHI